MTVSICVRDDYVDDEGDAQARFGVGVVTRVPGIGAFCPHVSENGAIATQSLVNVDLGRLGVEYLDDGLTIDSALRTLLDADDGRASRQVHGVDDEGGFAHTGTDCGDWAGDVVCKDYTVAGNLLDDESVVEAVADTYESKLDRDSGLLSGRLVDALAAGYERYTGENHDLGIRSAAVLVRDTGMAWTPYYDDIRVDATETPISDLRETHENAVEGHRRAAEEYGW